MSKQVHSDTKGGARSSLQNKEELKLKKQSDDTSSTTSTDNRRRKPQMLPDVFDERRVLVNKWFHKWNEAQRLTLLEELINHCKIHQLEQLNFMVARQKPIFRDDFTHILPRCVSLQILSYLDPRSLCRCAQVSWHWKSLAEMDQLWMHLCQQLSWSLTYSPTPFEKAAWKRLYVGNVVALKHTVTVKSKAVLSLEAMALSNTGGNKTKTKLATVPVSDQRPPWKGSDPTPRDIWRHNYLENEESVGKQPIGGKPERRQKGARMKTGAMGLRRSSSLSRLKTSDTNDQSELDILMWAQLTGSINTGTGAPFVHRHAPLTDFDVTAAFNSSYSAGKTGSFQPSTAQEKKFDMTVY